jgi:hypothetical protein
LSSGPLQYIVIESVEIFGMCAYKGEPSANTREAEVNTALALGFPPADRVRHHHRFVGKQIRTRELRAREIRSSLNFYVHNWEWIGEAWNGPGDCRLATPPEQNQGNLPAPNGRLADNSRDDWLMGIRFRDPLRPGAAMAR